MELRNYKLTALGGGRFALDSFIGAVRMREAGGEWQDIKPHLVRDDDGWHIEGAPYYAEVKDDGTRLFCPDRNERSVFLRLPAIQLFEGLPKNVAGSMSVLDGQVLDSRLVMPASWGEIRFIFTNTGMKFEVLFEEAPPEAVLGDSFLFTPDESGLDLSQLLASGRGTGVPRPRLIGADGEERWLDWSYESGQLELGFNLTGLEFPVLLKNTTVDIQVGAGTDDAGKDYAGSWSTSGNILDIGKYGTTASKNGLRFQGVTIPDGATIDAAYLTLTMYQTASGRTIKAIIYAESADSPATFSTEADYDGRSLTSASVAWEPAGGTQNDEVNTPSIVSVIEELVAARSYASGRDMAFLLKDNGTGIFAGVYRYYAYDLDTAKAPELHIEYTAGGGGADSKRGWWSK